MGLCELETEIEKTLVPCSKCGSKAYAIVSPCCDPLCCAIPHRISCSFCYGFETESFNSIEEARDEWNKIHGVKNGNK